MFINLASLYLWLVSDTLTRFMRIYSTEYTQPKSLCDRLEPYMPFTTSHPQSQHGLPSQCCLTDPHAYQGHGIYFALLRVPMRQL